VIIELYPDLFPPYNNRGQILLKLGRLDEAIKALEQAAEVEPRSAVPLWGLVRTHLWLRLDPASALEAVRRLLALMPEHAGALNLLGWCLAAEDRFTEAEEAFRAVLEQEPRHPLALPNLGHLLMRTDRPGEAVPIYREVAELVADGRMAGSDAWSNLQLALALQESGQTEEARELLDAATERVRSAPPAGFSEATRLLVLAALDAVRGDRESAEERLEEALSGNVAGPVHQRTLAEVYSLLGKRDDGLEALRKAIESGREDIFFLRLKPTLRSLQDDPRFDKLIEQFTAG
jgi:tetratricopeptide (TPR) repeat protein